MTVNEGDQEEPEWIHQGQIYLSYLITSYDKMTSPGDERKAVTVVCLEFSKAFR